MHVHYGNDGGVIWQCSKLIFSGSIILVTVYLVSPLTRFGSSFADLSIHSQSVGNHGNSENASATGSTDAFDPKDQRPGLPVAVPSHTAKNGDPGGIQGILACAPGFCIIDERCQSHLCHVFWHATWMISDAQHDSLGRWHRCYCQVRRPIQGPRFNPTADQGRKIQGTCKVPGFSNIKIFPSQVLPEYQQLEADRGKHVLPFCLFSNQWHHWFKKIQVAVYRSVSF